MAEHNFPVQAPNWEAMQVAIAECHRIDEIKDWRDKALALEAYARQALNIDLERNACIIRLRAERKCGLLIRERQASGDLASQGKNKLHVVSDDMSTLEDVGLSRDQSSKFQKLADIPEEEFEEALETQGTVMPTTSGLIRIHRKIEIKPVPKAVVELYGWIRSIERKECFKKDPTELIAEMTPLVRENIKECLPQIIDFIIQIKEILDEKLKS